MRLVGTVIAVLFSLSMAFGQPVTETAPYVFTAGIQSYLTNNVNNAQGVAVGNSAGNADISDSVNVGFFAGGGTPSGSSVVRVGRHAGFSQKGDDGLFIGHAAGQYAFDSGGAVSLGYLAGRNGSQNAAYHGFSSVIIGVEAGTNGLNNQTAVLVGGQAGRDAANASGSVMLGNYAGAAATAAPNAVFAGVQAGYGAAVSSGAVMIGHNSGMNAVNSVGSVLIGEAAAQNLSRHYTLVIEGHPSYAPAGSTGLIYGEFDNRLIRINGKLSVGTATLNLTNGALGVSAIAPSGTAPGAAGGKLELVCGTNPGTGKLIMSVGTSSSPAVIADNVGAGLNGC